MSIKTNELPQVAAVQAADAILVDTADGTKRALFSQACDFFETELKPAMQKTAVEQINVTDGFEAGSVRITNSQAYPFNAGVATVDLRTPRQSMDYVVDVEVVAATGNIQTIEVYDKQLNGFKIRYDGSATNVTIKYYVTGGMQA